MLDALACAEAVCANSPSAFLNAVHTEGRHDPLLELRAWRTVHTRGVNVVSGHRLLKTQITYTFERDHLPDSEGVCDFVTLIYAFWSPSNALEDVLKASCAESIATPRRSLLSGPPPAPACGFLSELDQASRDADAFGRAFRAIPTHVQPMEQRHGHDPTRAIPTESRGSFEPTHTKVGGGGG